MKVTDNKQKESTLLVGKQNRVSANSVDEHYIKHYLDKTAKGQRAALQSAYDELGIDKVATTQRAYEIHNRLRDDINKQLVIISSDDKALGRSVLRDLAQNAESESVKASTAQTLAKGLYNEVVITKDETITDIDSELQSIQQQIKEKGGIAKTH